MLISDDSLSTTRTLTTRILANPEQYTLGPDGKRTYTLKKVVDGKVSKSA